MLIYPSPPVAVPTFPINLVTDIELTKNEGLAVGSAIHRNHTEYYHRKDYGDHITPLRTPDYIPIYNHGDEAIEETYMNQTL